MHHSSPNIRPEFLKSMEMDFSTTVCESIIKKIADSVMFAHDMYPIGYIQMFFQSQKLTSEGTAPPLGFQRTVKITGVPRNGSDVAVARAISSYMDNSEELFQVSSDGVEMIFQYQKSIELADAESGTSGFAVSVIDQGSSVDGQLKSEKTRFYTIADYSAKATHTSIPLSQPYIAEIRANDYGDKGNLIEVIGDGTKSLELLISEWNVSNPDNTAAVVRGHSIVIPLGLIVKLSGGDDGLDGKYFVIYDEGGSVAIYFDMQGNVPAPNANIWTICDGHIISDPDSILDGQATPNLMDKFLKHTIQDTVGGAETFNLSHNHGGNTGVTLPPQEKWLQFFPFKRGVNMAHSHTIGTGGVASENKIPPYAEFQPFIRYK